MLPLRLLAITDRRLTSLQMCAAIACRTAISLAVVTEEAVTESAILVIEISMKTTKHIADFWVYHSMTGDVNKIVRF